MNAVTARRELNKVSVQLAEMLPLGHQVIYAVSLKAMNVKGQFNRWIKDEIRKRKLEDSVDNKNFDYYGYVEGVFRRMGLKSDDLDEAIQWVFVRMFVREGGKDLFNHYKGRIQGPFERFFQTTMKRRAQTYLRDMQTKGGTRERSRGPSLDKNVGENTTFGQLQRARDISDLANIEYQDLLRDLAKDVKRGDNYGGDMVKVFEGLLRGRSTRTIRDGLSHKSASWYTKVLQTLRSTIKSYFTRKGHVDIAKAIDKLIEKKR